MFLRQTFQAAPAGRTRRKGRKGRKVPACPIYRRFSVFRLSGGNWRKVSESGGKSIPDYGELRTALAELAEIEVPVL